MVSIEEIGGPFRTRAAVRNTHVGADRIRRVGLEFLDREAPASLVPSDHSARPSPATPATPVTPVTPTSPVTPLTPTNSVRVPTPATPVPAPTASSPRVAEARAPMAPVTRDEVLAALERAGSRSHFEVLGVAQTANDAEVRRKRPRE